jgi:hypothetical protein
VDLAPGEQVVMSFLSEVTDGMRVRVKGAAGESAGTGDP